VDGVPGANGGCLRDSLRGFSVDGGLRAEVLTPAWCPSGLPVTEIIFEPGQLGCYVPGGARRTQTGALRCGEPPAWRCPAGRYDHPVRATQAGARVLEERAQVTSTAIPVLVRRGATAVAAGRVALGLTALAWPLVPARPWVGAAADDLAARVFGRALGARDVALGLGALNALARPAAEPGSASAWLAAGALSDALDVVASLAAWNELPRLSRWLVAASAGGAALAGAAGALAVRPAREGASA